MGFSVTGLSSSGIDWQDLISQLSDAETESKITPLTTQKTAYQDKLSAWKSVESKLETLQTAIEDLKDSADFNVFKTSLTSSSTVSADSLLSVTTNSNATQGTYKIKITQLAEAEKIQSASVSSQSSDAGWTGSITLEGNEITLDGKSLQTLRDEINALNTGDTPSGVTATILKVSDSDYRLILTNDETGAEGMTLTDNSTGHNFSIEDSENPGTYILNTLQEGLDAQFSIDDISMTRSSNTISDAITGVTLNLEGEDTGTTVTVNITQDTDAVTTKIQSFITAYNSVLDYYDEQMSYDSSSDEKGGALFGDNTLKSIKSSLQNILLDSGVSSLGITVNEENRLELDTDELESALEDDPGGTVSLFNSMATSLNNQLDTYTDSIDGTITLTEESLQTSIDNLEDKITNTQDFIDRKLELLTNQFINLESALETMKAQMSYVTSTMSSLSGSS